MLQERLTKPRVAVAVWREWQGLIVAGVALVISLPLAGKIVQEKVPHVFGDEDAEVDE